MTPATASTSARDTLAEDGPCGADAGIHAYCPDSRVRPRAGTWHKQFVPNFSLHPVMLHRRHTPQRQVTRARGEGPAVDDREDNSRLGGSFEIPSESKEHSRATCGRESLTSQPEHPTRFQYTKQTHMLRQTLCWPLNRLLRAIRIQNHLLTARESRRSRTSSSRTASR